jgi:dihydroneopterin aldolase
MAVISIENMEFFAYHGCFEEEQIIGNRFLVNLEITTDTAAAERSDKLTDTVNYQRVYQVIGKEMEIKSKLLEHLARRIMDAVKREFPEITSMELKVSKLNPPIGGKVECVSVSLRA